MYSYILYTYMNIVCAIHVHVHHMYYMEMHVYSTLANEGGKSCIERITQSPRYTQ